MIKKRIQNSFLIAIVFATVIFIGYYFLVPQESANNSFEFYKPYVFALILNMFNLSLSIILFAISYKKDNKTFLVLNLGGMVLRVFIQVLFITILINVLNIEKLAFIFTFFIFYFIYLIIEIKFYSIKFIVRYDANRS